MERKQGADRVSSLVIGKPSSRARTGMTSLVLRSTPL